jgi:hypothetical protein
MNTVPEPERPKDRPVSLPVAGGAAAKAGVGDGARQRVGGRERRLALLPAM